MANSHEFNHKAQFVIRRAMRREGRSYQPGDLFKPGSISNRRFKALYDSGYIWYGWQYEAAKGDAEVKAEVAKPVEAPKVVAEVKVESEDKAKEEVKEAKSEEKTEEKVEKPVKAPKKKSKANKGK